MSSVNSLASFATAQSQAQLQQQVGVALAKKSQDVVKQQGEAAISLLRSAAQLQAQAANTAAHLGNRLDVAG